MRSHSYGVGPTSQVQEITKKKMGAEPHGSAPLGRTHRPHCVGLGCLPCPLPPPPPLHVELGCTHPPPTRRVGLGCTHPPPPHRIGLGCTCPPSPLRVGQGCTHPPPPRVGLGCTPPPLPLCVNLGCKPLPPPLRVDCWVLHPHHICLISPYWIVPSLSLSIPPSSWFLPASSIRLSLLSLLS